MPGDVAILTDIDRTSDTQEPPVAQEESKAPEITERESTINPQALRETLEITEPFDLEKYQKEREQARKKAGDERVNKTPFESEYFTGSYEKLKPIFDRGRKLYLEKHGRSDQFEAFIDRELLIQELTKQGIQDAPELLAFFERQIIADAMLRNNRRYNHGYIGTWAANNYDSEQLFEKFQGEYRYLSKDLEEQFQTLYTAIGNPDKILLFQSIPHFARALERLSAIGGYVPNITEDLNDATFLEQVLKLSNLSDEDFAETKAICTKYSLLWQHHEDASNAKGNERNKVIAPVINLMAKGQLTEDEKETLALADQMNKILYDFAWDKRSNHNPIYNTYSKDTLLQQRSAIQDDLTIAEELVAENTNFIINEIPRDLRAPLARLIRTGWQIPYQSVTRENVQSALRLSEKLADAKTLERVSLAADAYSVIISGNMDFFSLKHTPAFETFLQEDTLKSVATIAQIAQHITPNLQEKRRLLSDCFYISRKANLDMNINPLVTALKNASLESLPDSEKRFWQLWLQTAVWGNEELLPEFLLSCPEKVDQFKQDSRLSLQFLQEFKKYYKDHHGSENNYSLDFFFRPETCPKELEPLVLYCKEELPNYAWSTVIRDITSWEAFFKGNEPQPLFYLTLASEVPSVVDGLINNHPGELSPWERDFWDIWKSLPQNLQSRIPKLLKEQGVTSFDKETLRKVRNLAEPYTILEASPSKEVQRLQQEIWELLSLAEDPVAVSKEIRNVFEKNNLPEVAKIYRCFEIVCGRPRNNGKSFLESKLEEDKNLSPVLRQTTNKRRYDIIYKDLLKVHIESSNPSLRRYIATLLEGQVILDKVDREGIESLDTAEQAALTRFLNRIDQLAINSLYGRRQHLTSTEGQDVALRIAGLKATLGVRENQRIVERIAEMFAKPLGFKTLDEVVQQMEQARQEAQERNLDFVKEATQLHFVPGDLVKGVEHIFLSEIMQNGSVSKEYLSGASQSDSTPFDTDVSMVMPEDDGKNLGEVVSAIDEAMTQSYGDLLFVIRNREQMEETKSTEPAHYDSLKYELFSSPIHGERHYAIRTGFPSTEISFMVARDELKNKPGDLERIFFTIAQNDLYIPIADMGGNVIFTPDMYEKYKVHAEETTHKLTAETFTPEALIATLKESPYMKRLYESSVGVHERYSLEQHTAMAMRQYEKYFTDRWKSPLLTEEQFRLALALHDLGKPLAVELTGQTKDQHEYTMTFVPQLLDNLGIDPKTAEVMIGLTDHDYLGEYFKGDIPAGKAAQLLRHKAESLGVGLPHYMALLKMYYMCDAGSYTADAGGQASLDNLFVFIHGEGGEKGRMEFDEILQGKYDQLTHALYSPAAEAAIISSRLAVGTSV